MKGLKKFLAAVAVLGGIAAIGYVLYNKFKSAVDTDEFDDFEDDDFDDDFDDIDIENRGYTSIPVEAEEAAEDDDVEVDIVDEDVQ